MKGTKEQKGITLIALIITIVVLLILAAVAISSISNDGILHYAQNAADSWNKAQANEQDTLSGYVDWLKYATCSHTYVNGICSNCGYSPCAGGHTWGAWGEKSEVDCKEKRTCTTCGNTEQRDNHNWDGDGYCLDCEQYCSHDDCVYDNVQSEGDGRHNLIGSCTICGRGDSYWQDCTYENGVCTVCGYEEPECEHTNTTTTYTSISNEKHQVATACADCGAIVSTTEEEHWLTANGSSSWWEYCGCESCGFEIPHDWSGTYIEHPWEGCHRETNSCNRCDLNDEYDQDCEIIDGKCSICGQTVEF